MDIVCDIMEALLASVLAVRKNGTVSIAMDPLKGEWVLLLKGKFSPAAQRLQVMAGSAVRALLLLSRAGATICANSWRLANDEFAQQTKPDWWDEVWQLSNHLVEKACTPTQAILARDKGWLRAEQRRLA